MIRVNLLPQEERTTRRSIKLPQVGSFAPFLALPVVLGLVAVSATLEQAKLKSLRGDVTEVQDEVRKLQPQVDRVKRLTAKREELERRLDVIHQLDRDRFLSVRIMDDVSRQLPKYMWFSDLTQNGPGSVTLSGVTFSNLIVADLMMRMEQSSMFANVDLLETERGEIDDREVIQFAITARVTPEDEGTGLTADAAWPEEE